MEVRHIIRTTGVATVLRAFDGRAKIQMRVPCGESRYAHIELAINEARDLATLLARSCADFDRAFTNPGQPAVDLSDPLADHFDTTEPASVAS